MASDGGKTIGFRADEELQADVESHRARHGYDTTSKATKDLVRVGLRESNAPILSRLRESTIQSAYYLAVTAITLVIIGLGSPVLEQVNAMKIAAVLLAFGGGLVALAEVGRMVTGQNELSVALRERGEEAADE